MIGVETNRLLLSFLPRNDGQIASEMKRKEKIKILPFPRNDDKPEAICLIRSKNLTDCFASLAMTRRLLFRRGGSQ
jgi:hypothetical protein